MSLDGLTFLRSGLTTEFLNCMGNVSVDNNGLMILLAIVGTRRVAHSLSIRPKGVGIVSR